MHYLGEIADFLDHLLAAKVKPGHVHGAPGVVHQTLARQHALQHQDHRQSLQLPLAHLQGTVNENGEEKWTGSEKGEQTGDPKGWAEGLSLYLCNINAHICIIHTKYGFLYVSPESGLACFIPRSRE